MQSKLLKVKKILLLLRILNCARKIIEKNNGKNYCFLPLSYKNLN